MTTLILNQEWYNTQLTGQLHPTSMLALSYIIWHQTLFIWVIYMGYVVGLDYTNTYLNPYEEF